MNKISVAAAVLACGFAYAGDKTVEISVSEKANSLVVERTIVEDKARDILNWKRYAECSKSGSGFQDMAGEQIFILNLYKPSINIYLADYNCDGKVDYFLDLNTGKSYERGSRNAGAFKNADQTFKDAKKELNSYINLEKLTKEWLDKLNKQSKPKTMEI